MNQFTIETAWRKHVAVFLPVMFLGLASLSCLHRRGPAMALFQNNGKVMLRGDCPQGAEHCFPIDPTPPDDYASGRYDQYQRSGFVSLQADMRLRIVSPILRPGSKLAVQTVAETKGPANASPLAAKASDDLLGYQTAFYNIDITGKSGQITVELDSIDLQPAGKNSGTELTRKDYLKGAPQPGFFRLYFQTRESPSDRAQALLASASQGELNLASSEFEDSAGYCDAPHKGVYCTAFPPGTAVNAEIKVYLKKRAIYLPLSATVDDALKAGGVDDPKAAIAQLSIRRLWDAQLVPLQFSRQSTAVLAMPLIGGDRLRW
jgi:hypothetical protein